jgi:hypothetical protein
MILELLPSTDLRSMTQVSVLLRDLAAPLYFRTVGLQVDKELLEVDAQNCIALPVFIRTTSFRTPEFLRFDLLGISDRNLTILLIFLELLKGVQSGPIWSVTCSDAPPGVDLASLFQLIKDLGCYTFSYSCNHPEHSYTVVPDTIPTSNPSRTYRLHRLSVDSPVFFSPRIAPLTLATLRDSPIVDLSLIHTTLSGIQWTTLLQNVHLPLLRFFKVDIQCPPDAIARFLACHRRVEWV